MLNVLLLLVILVTEPILGQLPPGCTPLNEQPFSTVNPADEWGSNGELWNHTPPKRFGAWGDTTPKPTHHFACNQATNNMVATQNFPYAAYLTNEGVTWDAYTLERWWAPDRQETMEQQTPSVVDEPWNKVISVGTNMRQMVIGPDGNPKAQFTGRSGIRLGLGRSGDPIWQAASDMHADWYFEDITDPTKTMEVPMVRGSALVTHLYSNSNPRVTPLCLSTVNGESFSYQCPMENAILDIGEGYLEGSCTGTTLNMVLYLTKPYEVNMVQYAVSAPADWPPGMVTCTDECTISPDGKRVDISVPVAGGTVNYAVNVIGRFLIPNDWVNEPYQTPCVFDDKDQDTPVENEVSQVDIPSSRACASAFCHTPSCPATGEFELIIELGSPIGSSDEIQFSVDTADNWVDAASHAPMLTCGTSAEHECVVSPDMMTITHRSSGYNSENFKYAVNVVGRFVQPPGDWQGSPFEYSCGDPPPTEPPGSTTTTTTVSPTGPPVDPGDCAAPANIPPCPNRFCKYHLVEPAGDGVNHILKIVTQYDEPLDSITDIQIAFNSIEGWDSSHPMVTCTAGECFLSAGNTVLTYCRYVEPAGYAYAINVIGRMIQPPSDWEGAPFWFQAGGTPTEIASGTKFVLELDEPGDELPDQTRKYVLYFSESVRALYDADGLTFEPTAGGKFTGLVQMGYTGAGVRGDTSNDDYFDSYVGTYPSSPVTSYCVDNSTGTGYVNVDWNKQGTGSLLMVGLPHHESLLSGGITTPFTYSGHTTDQWLLAYPLQQGSMMPNADAVDAIQQNPAQLQDILNGLDLDEAGYFLDDSCLTGGSYWAGKDIAMVARAASISRAFGTDHYQTFDVSLRTCLDKWIRVDDTLDQEHRLLYETAWGGLISHGEPFDPNINFGFPTYNDHHFHLGYWVYAMAYYAQHYPQWGQDNRERLLYYVRDFANPSPADPYFPIARHKDFYIGHSWASGIAGGTRTQESSTESIAAYHGVAALGHALGDVAMENFGRLLLATEIYSVREYYHVRQDNFDQFPPLIQEYGAIGMFSEEALYMYTLYWPCGPNIFPARHACLVGIQVIPITAIAGAYMDQDWAASVWDVCQWSINPTLAPGSETIDPSQLIPVEFGWGAFCLAASAPLDEATNQQAADYIRGRGPSDFVSGTGSASTYLWLYGRT